MALQPGTRLGIYQIVAAVGVGGMGEVYQARDTTLGREVAIKTLPALVASPDRIRRFEQEARAASALNHPNILTIHGMGQEEDLYYIVTEYITGETLRSRLQHTRMDIAEALDVAIQIAGALGSAHQAGIVHRDVKPANLMLRPDGLVKVLDFGVAKLHTLSGVGATAAADDVLTQPGMVVGTLNYMSPEQARGLDVDARTDLFSLGVVLYEMVSGHPPFERSSSADVIVAILQKTPAPLVGALGSVPPELQRIVGKALLKKRDERYQTAEEMIGDLRTLRQNLGAETRIASAWHPAAGRARRVLIPAGAVACLAMLGFWLMGHWRPSGHVPSPEASHWYQVGTDALRDGSYYQASRALSEAVKIDPTFVLAHARLAEAWTELDYSERAKDELLRVTELVPDRSALSSGDRLYLKAVTGTATRDFTAAVAAYREILGLESGSAKAQVHVDLGRAYEKNDEIERAVESCAESARLEPNYAAPFLRLGILHGRRQDLAKASSAFSRAEEIYSLKGNVEGRAEVCYQRGTVFLKQGRTAASREQLERALGLARASGSEPQQIQSLLQLSDVEFDAGAIEESGRRLNEAIQLAEQHGLGNLATRGLIKLGDRAFRRGELGEAEGYFSRALAQAAQNRARYLEALSRFDLGSLRIQQRKLDDGLRYLEEALAYYRPGGYRQEVTLGLTLMARANRIKGNYQAALEALEQQLPEAEKAGSTANVLTLHTEIGRVLELMERYPEALGHFEKSSDLSRSVAIELNIGYGLVNRGRILARLGRSDEARRLLGEAAALVEQPDRYRPLLRDLHLARAELALGELRFGEAQIECRRALALSSPQDSAALSYANRLLGLAQARSGAARQGLSACREAVALAEKTADEGLIVRAQLALAEAGADGGDPADVLRAVGPLVEKLTRSKQRESAWRADFAGALASRRAGQGSEAALHAARAEAMLEELGQSWGAEQYRSYLMRPDVRRWKQQLVQLREKPIP